MRDADNIPRTQFQTSDRPPRGPGPRSRPAGQRRTTQPVNERSYRRIADPASRPGAAARPAERDPRRRRAGLRHPPADPGHRPRGGDRAGRPVAVSLGFLHELDAGETTVSTADDQNNRHRVFCDLLLPDRSRCPQEYEHERLCGELPAAPEQRPVPRPAIGP